MWKEFRKFIARGNIIDLAVGVIIGTAFTAIVNSLVNDMIMPLINLLTGGLDFSGLKIETPGEPVLIGSFIGAVVQFLLISIVIFFFVKGINKLYKKPEAPPAPKRLCPFCKQEIADEATRCPFCTSVLTEGKEEA